MQIVFLNLSYTQKNHIGVGVGEYIDHNETNLDTNEWKLSVNEQQRV